jgi:hypothetical protein
MRDGFTASYGDLVFPARTKFGEALPPGRYVAAIEYQGLSRRLQVPVEVTE